MCGVETETGQYDDDKHVAYIVLHHWVASSSAINTVVADRAILAIRLPIRDIYIVVRRIGAKHNADNPRIVLLALRPEHSY